MQSNIRKRFLLVIRVLTGLSLVTLQPALGADISDFSAVGQKLEGAWVSRVTRPDLPDLLTIQSFFPGGLVSETSNSGNSLRSVSHGQWVRTGDRLFAVTGTFFRYNAQGQYIGITRVTSNILLADNLREWRATTFLQFFDPEGTLQSTREDVATATRMDIGNYSVMP